MGAVASSDLSGLAATFAGHADAALGPGIPMAPAHPEAVQPRIFDYQPGRNLVQTPRAFEPVSFDTLRRLCDSYDIARIAIEARKDEARGWEWDVRVKPIAGLPRDQQRARAAKFADAVARTKGFLASPNQEDDLGTWLTMYLDDLFKIDAPTLYLRPTRSGELYAVEVIDGATIRVLIDDYGRLPAPPLPAYGQVIKGITWNYFTRDQIIYEPYHQSPTSPYGSPPMEWVLLAVNRALRRQTLDLSLFTEGTLPVSYYKVPESWSGAQLAELQEIFDKLLAGNDLARSRVRFVPGGAGTGPENVNPTPSSDAEQWLMHITAAAFGTSAYELGFEPAGSGLGGAGFGEASRASAEKRGSRPLAAHLAGLLNRIIAGPLGMPELEFTWRGLGQSEDLLKEAQRNEIRWKAGAYGTDEWREDMGLDPIGMEPSVYDPKIGVVLVKDLLAAGAATAQSESELTSTLLDAGGAAGVPSATPGETTVGQSVGEPATKSADLAAWQRKALRAVKDGRDPARFSSDAIDPITHAAISGRLAKAASAAAVHAAFASEVPS